jgi:acyl dehydratase
MTVTDPHGADRVSSSERRVVQRGLYFEEFSEHVVYVHSPGRTVSEADNTIFSTLTMNSQALHLDAEWSAKTEFGERLINSIFTLATLVGTSVSQLTQGTVVANLGFRDVRFPHPMRAGDTMMSETRVTSKRLSKSRPGQGIVEFEHTARNQHGHVVAVATRTTLVLCSTRNA